MRVVITTQVFPPEIHPTAVMAHELAEDLVRLGWSVTVAAGLPHHPTGTVADGYQRLQVTREVISGYNVIRCWHPTAPRTHFANRAAVMACQTAAIGLAAALEHAPDIVLSFGGPPLFGPLISGLLAKLWHVPLVSVIHDIYPDVAIETGKLKNPAVVALVSAIEKIQYRLSSKLIVLGDASRRLLVSDKHVPDRKVEVVPVWLDPTEITPLLRMNPWRVEQAISEDTFVVLYSGTAGMVSGAEILEDVAARLPEDVMILLVGGGSAWNALLSRARQSATPRNLRLLPYQPRSRLPQVQASSDLSLVTLAPGRGRTSVPSKVQGYMAAGRAILASVDEDCDTARIVERERCGIVIPPGDAAAMADTILRAKQGRDELAAMGRRARAAFEREHARGLRVEQLEQILRDTIGVIAS
jgi:colanic acid biosynthesis glycosyl transferase WcaI